MRRGITANVWPRKESLHDADYLVAVPLAGSRESNRNLHEQGYQNVGHGVHISLFLFFFSLYTSHYSYTMHTIGIDMSKASFHAAFDETSVKIFKNTREGILMFIETLTIRGCTPPETTIGTEATGVYHLLLCATLREHGWSIKVINPLVAHQAIQATLRKVKTDKHDALAIRRVLLLGAGYAYTDTSETLAFKTLFGERETLVHMRAKLRQQSHNHRTRQQAVSVPLHDGFKAVMHTLSTEIGRIEKKLPYHAAHTQTLLRSIPGVGTVTSAALVAHIGDIRRFSSPEKLVAYIGLDCRVHESGTSIRGKGYITKRGNRSLRHVLFNAAFIAKRYNPELGRYFEKKVKEGKHFFSALCAVERKLVHIIFAVWKRGTPFEER